MNFLEDKYIIMEIIPTHSTLEKGSIVEATLLKLDGLKLVDRLNIRLNKDKVLIKDFLDLCNYDNDLFIYKDTNEEILDLIKNFVGDYKLILIDDTYTLNYLKDINNKYELVFKYLDVDNIEEMVKFYKLEESNYLVDLVYEAIIRHFS